VAFVVVVVLFIVAQESLGLLLACCDAIVVNGYWCSWVWKRTAQINLAHHSNCQCTVVARGIGCVNLASALFSTCYVFVLHHTFGLPTIAPQLKRYRDLALLVAAPWPVFPQHLQRAMYSKGGKGGGKGGYGNDAVQEEVGMDVRNPLGRHRWVRLAGLQTTDLNGKYAEIVVPQNDDDRFGVRVQGEAGMKLIKRANLEPIPDEETAKVCRIAGRGEERFVGGFIQNTRWPLAVLEAMPWSASPIAEKLGFPLHLARVKPRSEFRGRADYDNQWATFMMIDEGTGFAPTAWQSYVGPVVVWRPGGAPVTAGDMCVFNDFLSSILDKYAVGRVRPEKDLTPEAWVRKRNSILENQRMNPHEEQYDDINI